MEHTEQPEAATLVRHGVECGHETGGDLPLSDVLELDDRRSVVPGFITVRRKSGSGLSESETLARAAMDTSKS